MASNQSIIPPHAHAKVTMDPPLKKAAPPPEYSATSGGSKKHAALDLFCRLCLFATAVAGIIFLATSKQTKLIPVAPGMAIPMTAKFSHSPAHTYLMAALSTAALYSIITGLIAVYVLVKPPATSAKLKFQFVILDSLLLAIMAAATGAAGGVSYIGVEGNSHSKWNKICDMYDTYCIHIGASVFLSLISSIALLLLVWINVYALSKKIVWG